MLCPSGAHLHRMLDHVLREVHTVVTLGRFVSPDPIQEPHETASGDDLRQAKREDVASLQPLFKQGPYRCDCGVPEL